MILVDDRSKEASWPRTNVLTRVPSDPCFEPLTVNLDARMRRRRRAQRGRLGLRRQFLPKVRVVPVHARPHLSVARSPNAVRLRWRAHRSAKTMGPV